MARDDGPQCGSPYCDRPAVAAAYSRVGGSVLVRTDHLVLRPEADLDFRCMECLLNLIQDHIESTPAITDPARARAEWLAALGGPA